MIARNVWLKEQRGVTATRFAATSEGHGVPGTRGILGYTLRQSSVTARNWESFVDTEAEWEVIRARVMKCLTGYGLIKFFEMRA